MANYNFYITSKQCKEQTKEVLRGSYNQAAGVTAIYFLFMAGLSTLSSLLSVFVFWWLSIPLSIISMFVIAILDYGYNNYCLNLAQGKPAKISNLFSGFGKKMGAIIKLTIKRFFLSIFWFILLIIPFIVKTISYSMATLMMIDNPTEYNSGNALKESKHLMKQNYGRYFKFVFSFFGWWLLCGITSGIATLWVMPIFTTNKAMFYENLKTDF